MSYFKCCHHCSKRYPTCHDKCPDYIEAKKKFEQVKERMREDKKMEPAKTDFYNKALWRKHKIRY